jgi:predicted  nucleic acid-binding Zn-ribbon protein
VKAAFPQAVATVQSFLTPRRRQDGVSIDSEVDAIALDGAATVTLADILVRYSNEVSRLVMAVDAAKTEAADKADTAFQLQQEIGRLRERLAKAEAPPY